MSSALERRPVVAAVLTAAGAAVATSRTQILVMTLACLLVLVTLGIRPLAVALVAATFVTRFRVGVGGASLLLEHVALVACAVALVVHDRGPALVAAARDRTAILFGTFVVWNGAVSAVQAAEPSKSLLIVAWLALDWMMLVVLTASVDGPGALVRPALVCCGVTASVAIATGVSAHLLGTEFGVSVESVTGAAAVHGLSHEPNVLGATLALWAFVAFTSAGYRQSRGNKVVVGLCVVGVLMSLTRAAALGLTAGVLVWSMVRGRPARRAVAHATGAFALLLAALWLAAPGVAGPVFAKGGQLVDFGSQTGQVRVDQWMQAVDDLRGGAWLTGLGANAFGQHHLEPTIPQTPTPAYLGNLPLQVLYDSGVVGLALLGGVLASLLSRHRMRDGRAAGLLTVYALCALGTSPFWFGTTWVLAAVAVVDRRRAASRPAPPTTADVALAGAR